MAAAPDYAYEIAVEQVRATTRQIPVSLSATSAGAALLVAVFWDKVDHGILLGWLGLFLLNHIRVLVSYLRHRDVRLSPEWAQRFARRFTFRALTAGFIWGFGAYLFYTDSLAHQALLSGVLYGLAGGAATLYAGFPAAFYGFVVPALTPISVRFALEGDSAHIGMLLLGLVVVVGTRAINRRLQDLLTESLALRFENVDLVRRLTEQKEAAEEARRQAEAANLAKSRFLASASHDLRQPLHALGLFSAALAARLHRSEEASIVANIGASVDALDSLFDALLDISKLDAGVVEAKPCGMRLQALFDRLQRDYGPPAQAKGVGLRIVPTRTVVRSDPVLLERILRNLVSNAVRYTPKGKILVGARRRGERLRIEVWDCGVGIPPECQDKIFDEFYQAGNPGRDRQEGMGLGLAIAGRLARLLDSRIDVASTPGKGSVFRIDVPFGELDEEAERVPAPVAGAALAGSRVLVIDDEAAVRDGMETLLSQWGCRVATAASLDEALARAAREPPDLVLCDYRLDAGTGIEALARLQAALGGRIPGILVSGDTAPEVLLEAKAAGYPLLHKPVRPAKLRALLSHVLGKRPVMQSG